METDNFVLGLKTKDVFRDSQNLEDLFDFSNFKEDHEFFRNKNEKSIRKF